MKIDNHSNRKKSKAVRANDEYSAALAFAKAAQAEAAKAKAKAAEALDEAERATDEAIRKGEELQERIRAEKADADACAADPNFDGHECSNHSRTRELLIKASACS